MPQSSGSFSGSVAPIDSGVPDGVGNELPTVVASSDTSSPLPIVKPGAVPDKDEIVVVPATATSAPSGGKRAVAAVDKLLDDLPEILGVFMDQYGRSYVERRDAPNRYAQPLRSRAVRRELRRISKRYGVQWLRESEIAERRPVSPIGSL